MSQLYWYGWMVSPFELKYEVNSGATWTVTNANNKYTVDGVKSSSPINTRIYCAKNRISFTGMRKLHVIGQGTNNGTENMWGSVRLWVGNIADNNALVVSPLNYANLTHTVKDITQGADMDAYFGIQGDVGSHNQYSSAQHTSQTIAAAWATPE